jgi:hypothetical protein
MILLDACKETGSILQSYTYKTRQRKRLRLTLPLNLTPQRTRMREKLSNRHAVTTIEINHNYRGAENRIFSIAYSRMPSGKIAELWINTINDHEKLINDDMRDTCASVSRSLQYGETVEQLAKSVLRDNRGKPLGWLGTVLDALKKEPVYA